VIFPTWATRLKPVNSFFTIVDLYESKMSEYDSSFAFVPLETLQDLRGIEPKTGVASVTSIQLRLSRDRPERVRDRLQTNFRRVIILSHRDVRDLQVRCWPPCVWRRRS